MSLLKDKHPTYYCSQCGKKLVIKKKERHSYSMCDGSKIFKVEIACPDRRFWNSHSGCLYAISEKDYDKYE